MRQRRRGPGESALTAWLRHLLYFGIVAAAYPFAVTEAAAGSGATITIEAAKDNRGGPSDSPFKEAGVGRRSATNKKSVYRSRPDGGPDRDDAGLSLGGRLSGWSCVHVPTAVVGQ